MGIESTLMVDPLGTADAIFDLSGNQERADQAYQTGEAQRKLDNAYRTQATARAEKHYYEAVRRDKNKLQTLVADAKKAGISPALAMGSPGATPISFNMPSGQGGRVAGTYTRESAFKGVTQIQRNLEKKTHLDNLEQEEDILLKRHQRLLLSEQMWDLRDPYNRGKPLYDFYYDNSSQMPEGTYSIPVEEAAEGMEGKWPSRLMLYGNRHQLDGMLE